MLEPTTLLIESILEGRTGDVGLQAAGRRSAAGPDVEAEELHHHELRRRGLLGAHLRELGQKLQHAEHRWAAAANTHHRQKRRKSYIESPPSYREDPGFYHHSRSKRPAASSARLRTVETSVARYEARANSLAATIKRGAKIASRRADEFLEPFGKKKHWITNDPRVSGHTLRRLYGIEHAGGGAGYGAKSSEDANDYLAGMKAHHPKAVHDAPTERHRSMTPKDSEHRHLVGNHFYETRLARVIESNR